MYRLLFIVCVCVFLVQCRSKEEGESSKGLWSNFGKLTENEESGINNIIRFYGGQCKYGAGNSVTISAGAKKYFTIEVSNSVLLEKLSDKAELPASNIAQIFFSNLKSEQINYSEIHVTVVFKNGKNFQSIYKIDQLQQITKRFGLCYKIVEYIKYKQYDEIKKRIKSSFPEEYGKDFNEKNAMEAALSEMQKVDKNLGDIQGVRLHGFYVFQTKDVKDILHISGVIIRDTKQHSHEFSIEIDLNGDKEDVYLLDYKL